MKSLSLAGAALLFTSVAAFAAPVTITASTASSYYTESGNYEPSKAHDGKQATSWVEGETGSGLGSWITLTLEGEQTLTGLRMWAGDWYDEINWNRANRPKEVEVRFADGSTEMITLKNEFKPQMITFAKPHKTTEVRLRIKSVYEGTTWFDSGISEVQFLTAEVLPYAPKKVVSSSVAPADGDGSYVAENAFDGISDSMWCEGNKEGDGTGEWLEIQLNKPMPVSKLNLVNGMASSLILWMNGNRATSATLAFSDGSTHDIEIKGTKSPQTIEFPQKTTESVRITFTGVTQGKKYNDLCLTEVSLAE